MSLTASFSKPLEYQYGLDLSKKKTVADALESATDVLKRTQPDVEDCSLLCVQHKMNGSHEVKKVKLDDPMQKNYKLHIQAESALLTDSLKENEAFKRMLLKPQVIGFCSALMGRVISGKAQDPASKEDSKKRGAQSFMDKSSDNKALFASMASITGGSCQAEDFAQLADDNYQLRNGDVHNTTDAALKERAMELMASGAIRLLQKDFP